MKKVISLNTNSGNSIKFRSGAIYNILKSLEEKLFNDHFADILREIPLEKPDDQKILEVIIKKILYKSKKEIFINSFAEILNKLTGTEYKQNKTELTEIINELIGISVKHGVEGCPCCAFWDPDEAIHIVEPLLLGVVEYKYFASIIWFAVLLGLTAGYRNIVGAKDAIEAIESANKKVDSAQALINEIGESNSSENMQQVVKKLNDALDLHRMNLDKSRVDALFNKYIAGWLVGCTSVLMGVSPFTPINISMFFLIFYASFQAIYNYLNLQTTDLELKESKINESYKDYHSFKSNQHFFFRAQTGLFGSMGVGALLMFIYECTHADWGGSGWKDESKHHERDALFWSGAIFLSIGLGAIVTNNVYLQQYQFPSNIFTGMQIADNDEMEEKMRELDKQKHELDSLVIKSGQMCRRVLHGALSILPMLPTIGYPTLATCELRKLFSYESYEYREIFSFISYANNRKGELEIEMRKDAFKKMGDEEKAEWRQRYATILNHSIDASSYTSEQLASLHLEIQKDVDAQLRAVRQVFDNVGITSEKEHPLLNSKFASGLREVDKFLKPVDKSLRSVYKFLRSSHKSTEDKSVKNQTDEHV